MNKTSPNYNTPENGVAMTVFEHMVDHFARHGKNGLPTHQNEWAVVKILYRFLGVKEE